MIKTFADKDTEKIYRQEHPRKFSPNIQRAALRTLLMIDNAVTLNDLRIPTSNHLEQLKGDRQGQYSIRINNQFRVCFSVLDNDYYDVEVTDYH